MDQSTSLKKQTEDLSRQLGQMITGYWVSQSLRVVVVLDIADRLLDKDQSAEELAAASGVQGDALYRVLRALASVGIFKEDSENKFSLTPLAELLCGSHPQSLKSFILMVTGAAYQAWGRLEHAVATGDPAFNEAFGQGIFEYLTENPREGKIFDEAMTGIHGGETVPMLDAYDFSAFKTIADIGGGNGTTLSGIIERYTGVQGILFDLPQVVARAKNHLSGRIQTIGGDFFQEVPAADAYVLRHIVHDWSDEDASRILTNCAEAMEPGGKVLIVESVIPTGNDPCFGKWLDLMMLTIGGKERTAGQFAALLESAGFKLNRIIPTAAEISVVEGVAA